jgi:predicted metalloprotease with PDZ domain
MNYHINCDNTAEHILQITLHVDSVDTPAVDLQLSAWRPGRYELSNYARNILSVEGYTADNQPLFIEKINRERWRVHMNGHTSLVVRYEYYAQQMDAGNSWLDENLVYINFINCLFYVEGRIDEPCQLTLQLPGHYRIACGLPVAEAQVLTARDFYHLVDSPLIASPTLQQHTYTVNQIPFHLWVQGDAGVLNFEKLLFDFQQFTEVQIRMMGEFPQVDYHFLLILLPVQFYHGVEHRNSTVMTLGPAEQITGNLYEELLGLASHELFHAWNVCAIRPKELLPYDLTQENYFPTGYVAEGVTTYYGDLFLARSGFFSPERYYSELTRTLNRHFMQSNTARLSLLQSSFDLWIDGYTVGVPNRKVSIYHKGALAALILDMKIRQATHGEKSLDDVMRLMWQRFGKTGVGYSHEDYLQIVEEVAGQSVQPYVEECLVGTAPLQDRLNEALTHVGCALYSQPVTERPGCIQIQIIPADESSNRTQWLKG